MKRLLLVGLGVVLAASVGYAAPSRTLFVKDDEIVELEGKEVGLKMTNIDSLYVDDAEVVSMGPYFRYGLFDRMTAYATIPYLFVNTDSDEYDDEQGIGDATVGVLLLADDGAENNCSIVTSIEVSLPTGDEDKRLGAGDAGVAFGLAFQIMLEPDTGVVFDGQYKIVPDEDDIASYGIGVIYEVNPRLWLTVEAQGTDQEFDGESPAIAAVGLTYKSLCGVRGLTLSLAGGGGLTDVSPDGVGGAKIAYEF
ncbi:MAG: transporter [Kiritimatiellae bacterium]|nr:transporter [Kiritimatiellia bacterium]